MGNDHQPLRPATRQLLQNFGNVGTILFDRALRRWLDLVDRLVRDPIGAQLAGILVKIPLHHLTLIAANEYISKCDNPLT